MKASRNKSWPDFLTDAPGFEMKTGNMDLEAGRRCLLSSRTLYFHEAFSSVFRYLNSVPQMVMRVPLAYAREFRWGGGGELEHKLNV
jgi:hypothetical protein